jgi:hypothetical protein
MPEFKVVNDEVADRFLKECGFEYKISEGSFLVVFQLPKPVAQFWWKGGVDTWGSQGVDVRGGVLEWGLFYRELMSIIWREQGFAENELGLVFSRINDIGEHDPQKFYYVWEVGQWNGKN